MPSYFPAMEDNDLLERFERCAIPRPDWTHRAHVQIAYLHVKAYPLADALARLRCGIQALNAANGVEEGPRSGYNETITVAFLRLVECAFRIYDSATPPTSNEFCDRHPELMSPKVMKLFYSPIVLGNPRSKVEFLEPDLAKLPEWPRES
jgi:hypothetical protein